MMIGKRNGVEVAEQKKNITQSNMHVDGYMIKNLIPRERKHADIQDLRTKYRCGTSIVT